MKDKSTKDVTDPYKDFTLKQLQSLPKDEQLKLFNKLDIIRNQAKTCNYAALYNAGAETIAKSVGIDKKHAQKILDAYWKRNWAVKRIAQIQVVKTIDNENSRVKGHWLWNPVCNGYIYMRNKKDVFSALNQSTGAYMFDMWLLNILNERKQLTGQFHDSCVLQVKKGHRDDVVNMLQRAMDKLNSEQGLNVKLGMDFKFGDNYSFPDENINK